MLAIVSASISWEIVLWLIGRSRRARSETRSTIHAVVILVPCLVRASTSGNRLTSEYHHLSTLRLPDWLLSAPPLNRGYIVAGRPRVPPSHYCPYDFGRTDPGLSSPPTIGCCSKP